MTTVVTPTQAAQVKLCTFFVGDLLLGLPVEYVVEVVRGERLTRVPLAPGSMVGLLNLRGRIVSAVDARVRLRLERRDADSECAHIILTLDDEQVSLVVDREGEVVVLESAQRYDVPETVPPDIRRLLVSAYRRDEALLLVLDPHRVLAVD